MDACNKDFLIVDPNNMDSLIVDPHNKDFLLVDHINKDFHIDDPDNKDCLVVEIQAKLRRSRSFFFKYFICFYVFPFF